MQPAANRVAKNTTILYIKMAITVFISLYVTRLVLAALGSKDFGIFSVVGGTIAMLGFLNASMAAAANVSCRMHKVRVTLKILTRYSI